MAIRWSWDEKIGEIDVFLDCGDHVERYKLSMYEGNALLIMLRETDKNWTMWSFWADRDHMKNCLGLSKGTSNIYNTPYQCFQKITFNPAKSHYWKTWLPAIISAFNKIRVEADKDLMFISPFEEVNKK